MKRPSGERAKLAPSAGCVRSFSPVRPSQTMATHLSVDSLTRVTRKAWSGKRAIRSHVLAPFGLSQSSQSSSFPVFASQIRAVPSQEPEAIDVPSEEYATEVRRPVWPRSERIGLLQLAS